MRTRWGYLSFRSTLLFRQFACSFIVKAKKKNHTHEWLNVRTHTLPLVTFGSLMYVRTYIYIRSVSIYKFSAWFQLTVLITYILSTYRDWSLRLTVLVYTNRRKCNMFWDFCFVFRLYQKNMGKIYDWNVDRVKWGTYAVRARERT